MTDSEKPEGDIEDAEGVTLDEEGNAEIEMDTLELGEGEEGSRNNDE